MVRAANADVADDPTEATAPAMALILKRVLRERLPIKSCMKFNFLEVAPPVVRLGMRLVTRMGERQANLRENIGFLCETYRIEKVEKRANP